MKTWLAILTAGSLLIAHSMNSDDDISSKLVEIKNDIVDYNAERAYASSNDDVTNNPSLIYVTVRDHVSALRAMIPLRCTDGFIHLQHIDDVNSSMPINTNKTSSITQEINIICNTEFTADDIKG
jgi:hypothetical protein